MTTRLNPAVWWIRRDLRLQDNQALAAALAHSSQIIPLFILDPILLNSSFVGPKRLAFLFASLKELDKDLHQRGSRLIIREGQPLEQLKALLEETEAEAIFAEADYSPYARQRDTDILAALPLELTEGVVVHPPGTVLKKDATPYTVFTPFSKVWKARPFPREADLLTAPEQINTPENIESLAVPATPKLAQETLFLPGSKAAQAQLKAFVSGESPPIYHYAQNRNLVDIDGTSKLSPYLRFGLVSARQSMVVARQAARNAKTADHRKGAEIWLNELIWREFYIHILFHFPRVKGQSFRANLADIRWQNGPVDFRAWCDGTTGYPIVDAPMRQLRQQGWMPNRARMIVASFLVKDLLVDWRWGEKHFMQHLVDGDPAANNGGWQWTAGTGTDAAPYFRIFNPVLQGKKFDADGDYVRRWLPELANVPKKFIHAPWQMSDEQQTAVGCLIGQDYPAPIIDHRFARERTLAAFKAAKQSS